MFKHQKGFGHLVIILLIFVIGVVGAAAWWVIQHNQKQPTSPSNSSLQTQATVSKDKTSTDLLYLKNIGFKFDYYNPDTNRAGDMVFTHVGNNLEEKYNYIFADYGTQDPRSPNDPTKRNVQPTFVLPLGTKVLSMVDGIVVNVETLYSNDQTVMVAASEKGTYIYETEHVNNVVVKKGDRVKAGQVIAEVSTHDSQYNPGFGIVEIGILHPKGSVPEHLCPFHYLDPSIKADVQKKILSVHKAWMSYINMPTLYDDANSAEPGCFTNEPTAG